ncbi:hypothetical protein TYRP_006971 [Tyrophagus putrescentiae]|nr:hypothetical protein TYRP_006971 [Tyrophagus putrescentiae]
MRTLTTTTVVTTEAAKAEEDSIPEEPAACLKQWQLLRLAASTPELHLRAEVDQGANNGSEVLVEEEEEHQQRPDLQSDLQELLLLLLQCNGRLRRPG